MLKCNSKRNSCKDVFNAFLVKNANYDGDLEIPKLKSVDFVPNKLISFSKSLSSKDFNQWVHFYEDDFLFERIWNNPQKYLPILKKFNGVISPDFSLYRDMPFVMQQWNTYRNRAIAHYLQENGVNVIPNIRWGDERTYKFCCLGVEKDSIIAIGSHGTIKNLIDRDYFVKGLDYIVEQLNPKTIIVYGTAPNKIFEKFIQKGINIVQFDSECLLSHKGGA